jgi:hypothetical protein
LVAGSAAGHGTDSILEIERVNGTDDNDTISGNDFGNTLFGFKGDDIMSGFAGDDFLVGREGFDTLDDGEGIDDCLDGESNTNCEFEKRRSKDVRVPTTVSWSNALRTSVSTKETIRIYVLD